MAPKRASKQQQQLNVDQYTLLKKPMEHLGKQLNVPGSFWQGRMSEDERDKIYKCTIVDFSLAQKVAPTSSPRMAFKVQEMGIDGTGSHEHSDLASTMYWIGYPMPFLRFFYDTFPAVDGASAGAAVVVEPERAGDSVYYYLLVHNKKLSAPKRTSFGWVGDSSRKNHSSSMSSIRSFSRPQFHGSFTVIYRGSEGYLYEVPT